jgi:hypothetical protein
MTIKAGAGQSDEYMIFGRSGFSPGGGEDLGDGFGFGVDVEFVIDIADMGADGADADAVFVGDLFVAEPVDEGVEDLVFPDGQPEVFDDGGGGGPEGLEDAAGDAGGHRGASLVEVADCLDDLFRGCFFKEVAGGAGPDGVEDVVVIVEYGEHEDLDGGEVCCYGADAFDAGDIGEADIHQYDIGQGLSDLADDVQEIVKGRDAPDAFRPVEEAFQAIAQRIVVFYDGQFDHWIKDVEVSRDFQ